MTFTSAGDNTAFQLPESGCAALEELLAVGKTVVQFCIFLDLTKALGLGEWGAIVQKGAALGPLRFIQICFADPPHEKCGAAG